MKISRRTRAAALASVCVALAVFAGEGRAQAPQAEHWEYGYSYMQLTIDGKHISNFVHDPKYVGWLTVEVVEIAQRGVGEEMNHASITPTRDHPSGDPNWFEFSVALKSGRHGPGKMSFGSGDDGGFDPVIDAMKKKALIPEAELDFYNIDTARFVGKYKVRGIRILSLENAAASACPMYEVTLSFQSIAKE